jgi:hypothetical protein
MLIDEISILPQEPPNLDEVLRDFIQYFQANYGTVSKVGLLSRNTSSYFSIYSEYRLFRGC